MLRIRQATVWPPVETGGVVRVEGRLRRLGPFEQHYVRKGAHAAITVDLAAATGARRGGLWRLVDVVRGRAETALGVGLAPPQAALLRGMALGQDEALSERTRDEFRTAGLSHLTAASGQNVALLLALALPLLTFVGLGLRQRLAVALGLIALYVPLAGAGPSIQRAGAMGAATTAAALAGRAASRWYALLLAAAATLFVNPRFSADPGWQLSFAAVVAIALATPAVAARLRRRGVPGPLAEAAAMTFAATLGTAPLLAFHFEELSLVSLPANLLAAPAVAPIMWLGMLAAAVGQLAAPLALPLNTLNACLLGYVGAIAHTAATVPHAEVRWRLPGPLALAAAYAAIATLIALVRRRARRPATGGEGRRGASGRRCLLGGDVAFEERGEQTGHRLLGEREAITLADVDDLVAAAAGGGRRGQRDETGSALERRLTHVPPDHAVAAQRGRVAGEQAVSRDDVLTREPMPERPVRVAAEQQRDRRERHRQHPRPARQPSRHRPGQQQRYERNHDRRRRPRQPPPQRRPRMRHEPPVRLKPRSAADSLPDGSCSTSAAIASASARGTFGSRVSAPPSGLSWPPARRPLTIARRLAPPARALQQRLGQGGRRAAAAARS